MNDKMKQFVNGGAPARLRHVLSLAGTLLAGAFAVGMLWSDVLATEKKANDNSKRVQAIEASINEVTTQQRLLLQSSETDRAHSKEFRDKTARTLERILERLPRSNGLPR
jgi:hypothetical protein